MKTRSSPIQSSQTALSSDRKLSLKLNGQADEIEIHGPEGELELRIVITPQGPVLKLQGVRLEVNAPELSMNCQNFAVNAEQSAQIASEGSVQVQSKGDMDLQSEGEMTLKAPLIRIN